MIHDTNQVLINKYSKTTFHGVYTREKIEWVDQNKLPCFVEVSQA